MQALIQCSRWEDAGKACSGLLPGVDQLYLRSELLWRQGKLPAAIEALKQALDSNTASSKCSDRLHYLQPIMDQLQQASAAVEDGRPPVLACMSLCSPSVPCSAVTCCAWRTSTVAAIPHLRCMLEYTQAVK